MEWSTAVHGSYRAVTTQLQSGFVCPGNSILINGHWELDRRQVCSYRRKWHVIHANIILAIQIIVVLLCTSATIKALLENGIFNNDMQLCNWSLIWRGMAR